MEKAILTFGPSGAGKSKISEAFAIKNNFLHYEADRWPEQDGIDFHNIRAEWDLFLSNSNPKPLYELLVSRARAEKKKGTILSLPSMIIDSELLFRAKHVSLHSIILYGSAAECIEAFLTREAETGRNLPLQHWQDFNYGSYMKMSLPDFEPFRIFAFSNGKRRSLDVVILEIHNKMD